MSKYFMRNTPLSGVEKMMMQPPYQRPSGGGVKTGYDYSTADCDCKYCLMSEKKKPVCRNPEQCICFEERLRAGCWALGQLANMLIRDAMSTRLSDRTKQVLPPSVCSPFRSPTHRQRVLSETAVMQREFAPYIAAVFLLSADTALWRNAHKALNGQTVNFGRISIRGIGQEGYALFQTAKDLYFGGCHLTVEELCDPQVISDELFRLIVSAFVIRRFGFPYELFMQPLPDSSI